MSSTPLRVPRRAPRRMPAAPPPPMVKDIINHTPNTKHISSPSTSSASTLPSPYDILPSSTPSNTLYSASPPTKHNTPPVVDLSSIISEDGGGTPKQMCYQSAQPLEINQGALQAWQMSRVLSLPLNGIGIGLSSPGTGNGHAGMGLGVGKATPRLPTRKTVAQKKREREGRRCKRVFYQGETMRVTVAFDEADETGEEETGYDVVVRLVCAGIPSASSSKARRCTLAISPELWADDSGTTVLGYAHMRSVARVAHNALSTKSSPSNALSILVTAPPIRAVDVLSLAAFLASSLSSTRDQSTRDSNAPPASPPRSPLEEIPTTTSFFPDTGTDDESIPSSPTQLQSHPESDTPLSSSTSPAPSSAPRLSSTPESDTPLSSSTSSSDPSAPSSSAVHFPPSPSQTHPNTALAHLLTFNASLDTALDTASHAAEWGWRGAVSRSGMACVDRLCFDGGDEQPPEVEGDLELNVNALDNSLDSEREEEGVTAYDVSFEHVALWKMQGASSGGVAGKDGAEKADGDKASDAGAERGRDGSVGSRPELS